MPVTTSYHSHVDIIVAMVVPTKMPWHVASSSGISMVACGELSPHRDLAMSANPGGGVHSLTLVHSGWVSAPRLEVASRTFTGVVAVGNDLSILQAATKEPQVWPLLVWLQLHSQDFVGSLGSVNLAGVILTQFEGLTLPKTLASVNIINSSILSLNCQTHLANWHGSPSIGGQAFSAQCCKAFIYNQGLFGLF